MIPTKPSIYYSEQSINNVIALKQYVKSIPPIYEALGTAKSELLLEIFNVRKSILLSMIVLMLQFCSPNNYSDVQAMIDETINEDITYQSQPLDLRNQRTYAVRVSHCAMECKGYGLMDNVSVVRSQWSP